MDSMSTKPKIGLIYGLSTFVNGVPHIEGALRFIKVLEPLCDEIIWITANNFEVENKISKKVIPVKVSWSDVRDKPILIQAWYYLSHQFKIMLNLVKLKKVDIVIFASGLDFYVVPISFARILLRKKVIIKSDGRSSLAARWYVGKGKKYKIAPIKLMESIAYFLANKIDADSTHAISLNNMQRYKNKICVTTADSYVDPHLFSKTKELEERKYNVGYIGRFHWKKGVLEFVYSLRSISESKHFKAVMIGNGPLDSEIRKALIATNTQNKVEVMGWVKPEELADYLNDTKLVIIPSYGEGMPLILLEAIACGCIVIATSVGSIPQVIQDVKTGFILEGNSPDQIAAGIIRAQTHRDLDSIAQESRALIEKEYTYAAAVERYQSMLASMN